MTPSRIITLALIIISSAALSGQGVDERAKDKAEQKANNRIDTRVDQGIDKGLDAIEGLFKKKKKKNKDAPESSPTEEVEERTTTTAPVKEREETPNNPFAGGMLGGGLFEAAEWESSYSFDFSSTAEITMTNKRGKEEKNEMNWMYGSEAMAIVVEDADGNGGSGLVIFDYVNHSFITLTEDKGEKNGIAMAMNKEQLATITEETLEEEAVMPSNFKKTGRTKEILGYTCHEYTFEDEEMNGVMWMTTEISVDMSRIYGSLAQSGKKQNTFMPADYPKGYAMEMTNTDVKSNEKHHYLITAINPNYNEKVDLAPYNVMDIMGMMKQGQK